jgi:hypothetical protein
MTMGTGAGTDHFMTHISSGARFRGPGRNIGMSPVRLPAVAALTLLGAVVGACSDNEESSTGRTPALVTSAPPTVGVISGEVELTIDARNTTAGDRGTFTITGAITDSGTVVTRRSQRPDVVVKEREFRGQLGTIFIHMEGTVRSDGSGGDFTWRITGATDEYEGLTGSGSGQDFFADTSVRGAFSGNVSN